MENQLASLLKKSGLTADRAEAEEQKRVEAENSFENSIEDSKAIIGDVEKVFENFGDKNWDWVSFYNGWLEGRINLLKEQKAALKGSDNQNLYSDYYE